MGDTMEKKPLVVKCDNVATANEFDKENNNTYRLSEHLSEIENCYVFLRRSKPTK